MEQNSYEHTREFHIDTIPERESWGAMVENLTTDLSRLWEKQSLLVSTELTEKITTMKVAAGSLATGGAFLFTGTLCLAATAILALSLVVAPWIAAAIVTAVFLVTGIVMMKGAQKKLAGRGLVPEQSIDAMKEIKTTFQERFHEFKRH